MHAEKYTVNQYKISTILGFIEGNTIAIPEIQRPFVWKRSQVRELIDSLYNGYPAGYLIIWQNPNVRLKDGKESLGKKILIDGQQRVTALMAAILGYQVIDDEYQETYIKIAFNPLVEDDEERFAVQDSSHLRSKKWISDISVLFRNDFDSYEFTQNYCEVNTEISTKDFSKTIAKLRSIADRQIGVIELVPGLDIAEVTEIFVRINSAGKRLNESDFAMSKIAADDKYGGNMLRKAIDYFCHLAVAPNYYSYIANNDKAFMQSEYADKIKWLKDDKESIFDPDYGDLLRVAFMHKFGKGKLRDLVSLLSGRNFETRTFEEKIEKESFQLLKEGVLNFTKEYNFNQFVLCIRSLGFVSEKLVNSQMTLDFAYTLYLLLSEDPKIKPVEVKYFVQKWYVLSTVTSRYITSPESVMDRDMRAIKSKGFLTFFKEAEEAVLSDTFWNVGLVQNLETSAINSPYFNIFVAAQIHASDRALFSTTTKIQDLLSIMGDIHHIFPKEYLKQNGFAEKSKYNQVANLVFIDTTVNITIGKKAPKEYFTMAKSQCETGNLGIGAITNNLELEDTLRMNCIPLGVYDMTSAEYEVFLLQRRRLMANKIREFYSRI